MYLFGITISHSRQLTLYEGAGIKHGLWTNRLESWSEQLLDGSQ